MASTSKTRTYQRLASVGRVFGHWRKVWYNSVTGPPPRSKPGKYSGTLANAYKAPGAPLL
jgi:hypothetical protein